MRTACVRTQPRPADSWQAAILPPHCHRRTSRSSQPCRRSRAGPGCAPPPQPRARPSSRRADWPEIHQNPSFMSSRIPDRGLFCQFLASDLHRYSVGMGELLLNPRVFAGIIMVLAAAVGGGPTGELAATCDPLLLVTAFGCQEATQFEQMQTSKRGPFKQHLHGPVTLASRCEVRSRRDLLAGSAREEAAASAPSF